MDTEERDRWLAQKQAEADDPNTDDDEVNEAPVTVINGEDE